MDARIASSDPDGVLASTAWLQALARELVSDAATADDVAQEAWLATHELGAGEPAPRSTGWLRAVIRNVAAKLSRSERRRARREHLAAMPEALPSTEELVQRAELQRLLTDAVLRLEEPFRTTILLRSFGGCSSAAIAAQSGVPEGTVRWRVRRGLALLRAELERRGGQDWLSVQIVLAKLAAASPPAIGAKSVCVLQVPVLAAAVLAVVCLGMSGGPARHEDDPAPVVATPLPARERPLVLEGEGTPVDPSSGKTADPRSLEQTLALLGLSAEDRARVLESAQLAIESALADVVKSVRDAIATGQPLSESTVVVTLPVK